MSVPEKAYWCERWERFMPWPGQYDQKGQCLCVYDFAFKKVCQKCDRRPPRVTIHADRGAASSEGTKHA